MAFALGSSPVNLTVDGATLQGAVIVQQNNGAPPSTLVCVVSTPRPDGYSLTQQQIVDTFTALHALMVGT